MNPNHFVINLVDSEDEDEDPNASQENQESVSVSQPLYPTLTRVTNVEQMEGGQLKQVADPVIQGGQIVASIPRKSDKKRLAEVQKPAEAGEEQGSKKQRTEEKSSDAAEKQAQPISLLHGRGLEMLLDQAGVLHVAATMPRGTDMAAEKTTGLETVEKEPIGAEKEQPGDKNPTMQSTGQPEVETASMAQVEAQETDNLASESNKDISEAANMEVESGKDAGGTVQEEEEPKEGQEGEAKEP